MNRTKSRFITILACFALLVLTLGLTLGALNPAVSADAALNTPSSLFGNAQTSGDKTAAYVADVTEAAKEDPAAYTTLMLATKYDTFDGSGNVNGSVQPTEGRLEYLSSLALRWFDPVKESPKEEQEGEAQSASVRAAAQKPDYQYYSMTFAFPEVNFETFTLTFESKEENAREKNGKAVNELVFKNTDGAVTVSIKDADHQTDEYKDYTPDVTYPVEKASDITLSFTESYEEKSCEPGEFFVILKNGENETNIGKVTNIGGYYIERSTSTDLKIAPMIFSVKLPAGAEKGQKILLKELNGQSLAVSGGSVTKGSDGNPSAEADGTVLYTGSTLTDTAAPALIFNSDFYGYTVGQKLSLDYKWIDVVSGTKSSATSATAARYLYVARKDENGAWVKPNTATQSDSYTTFSTNDYLFPTDDNQVENGEMYLSVRFTLDDGRKDWNTEYYYLDWYAISEDPSIVTTLEEGTENEFRYVVAKRRSNEDRSPEYTVLTADADTKTNKITEQTEYDRIVKSYQDKVNDRAKNASAGDGSEFYLPSLRELIVSKYADYRNLKFTICYYKPGVATGSTASSVTGRAYNNLHFEIEEPGPYTIRIFATDSFNNTMKLWTDETDPDDRQLVALTTTNIWDFDDVPEFTFNVGYTGAKIEDPGRQEIAYRGTRYPISSFDIVAYGSCKRSYSLYHFDPSRLPEGEQVTYSQLVETPEKYIEDEKYADCFSEPIKVMNPNIKEEDTEAWEKAQNDYQWNPGTTPGSFVPQEEGYYFVKLELKDPLKGNAVSVAYQVIEVQTPFEQTAGTIDWFRNNVTSVVLFSISAVLAIVIVILFIVKPSEKNVEDVDLDELKGKKPKKNKK